MTEISSDLLRALAAAAAASPDAEICGLLLGTADAIEAHRPCRNVAPDLARAFEIDPAALLAAHRVARAGGPAVIGHYHSHPGGRATPSPTDAAAAAGDGALWLILGADGAIGAWRAVAGGPLLAAFAPVSLRPRLASAR